MVTPEVEIDGLREFRRALKKVDKDLPKEMRATMRRMVADPIAAKIKTKVPVGPGKGGHWRDAIRGGATQRNAYIQWGKAKIPYAGWMEFGGQLPSKRSGKRARYMRPRADNGRWVYPTIEANREFAADAARKALDQTMSRARLALD